jgi:hypothetical protein
VIPFKAFETLISIISGSRERDRQEHLAFMRFYKDLVKIVPADVAQAFGSVQVPTRFRGVVNDTYRMELNVTDVLWWETIIQNDGGRFVKPIASVQRDIWEQLNKQIRKGAMTDEERALLLTILDENVEQG